MEEKPEISELDRVECDTLGTGNTTTPTNEPVNGHGVVRKDHAISDNSDVEKGSLGELSPQHRDYLIARHGTIDLDPLPTMDPADPLNWPAWKARK